MELVSRERRKRVTTGAMNRFLDKIDFQRASVPMNRRVKIYYMTQAAVAPPTFRPVHGQGCEAALQLRAVSGERDSGHVQVHWEPDLVQGEGAEQEGCAEVKFASRCPSPIPLLFAQSPKQ